MSKFRRIEVIQKIEETGIVPVFYHQNPDTCKKALEVCYAGGVRVFEFTNRGDQSHRLFEEILIFCRKKIPEMMLGVGTIVDPGTASLFIQAGADFLVSPLLHLEVIKTCNRRKILSIPGCATLSEISMAEEMGCEMVKIFPGDTLKPAFIKALKGPMPWTSVMVTGGVEPTEESLRDWFSVGVSAVGLGSQLFNSQMLESQDFHSLQSTVAQCLEWVRQIKRT